MMYWFLAFSILILAPAVSGHARLIDPPSRSSMWRFGYETPINYDDNELFCGGIGVQHQKNKGLCGVCGDAFHIPQPRPNEAGGKYARGIIVETYKRGEVINVTVEMTANHLGYFEFKICPHNNPYKIVSQACLDKYPLPLANKQIYKYYVKPAFIGKMTVSLKLPEEVICSQCVLQWQYRGENNWGKCSKGIEGLGCGPQETFRACADVSIIEDGLSRTTKDLDQESSTYSGLETTRVSVARETLKTTKIPKIFSTKFHTTETVKPPTTLNLIDNISTTLKLTTNTRIIKKTCDGAPNMLNLVPGLHQWCKDNCAMGHCPQNLCRCYI